MTTPAQPRTTANASWWILPALLYTIFHEKSPLYTTNQNTKFLHGAANAGYGWLENDWMGNTLNPLPVFSTLVEWLYQLQAIELSYGIFAILVFTYFAVLTRIVLHYFPAVTSTVPMLFYISLFVLFSKQDMQGLAYQYLLGEYLQPCVFGVFVLLSFERFINNRHASASIWLAIASAFHPAYLPTTFLVQAAYTSVMLRNRSSIRETGIPIALFLLLSAPLVLRHLILFAPTTPEMNLQAIDILANQRIPHHTDIHLWLDANSFIKLGVMAAAILIIRKSALSIVLLIPFVIIIISGIYLYIEPNATLAFTTPWRSSVFLLPLSIALISGWAAASTANVISNHRIIKPAIGLIATVYLIATTTGQVTRQIDNFRTYAEEQEMGAIAYASANRGPEQLYLIPPADSRMDKFRLETGIPVLINLKTHPYKDSEVMEWFNRNTMALKFYQARNTNERQQALDDLVSTYPVTHCITPAHVTLPVTSAWKEVYRDQHYVIRIKEANKPYVISRES
ncbi:hypothetical protein INT08_10680 [Prosthecochloris sp. N3]|uniref:DUF6798 domain-containing protein n=1 Tax=Prosthecochloris ethylica TaxID=2743976 RepID=A0ABR9XUI1_9CHLB|nr:DUF6798 domain-containing protein [Prosthecochloris ethylica]MBF0587337.1 hypothetical protein [Prosthecochloris ethylica]MBF0637634.1 hypothetical protein [Prosthecochloris ethylica]NUK48265.1 hypothetical protein [Prosthecochloris ethylica]